MCTYLNEQGLEIRDENALDRGDSEFENPLSPLKIHYPTYMQSIKPFIYIGNPHFLVSLTELY